jgi:PAS domain S-box-containing protein
MRDRQRVRASTRSALRESEERYRDLVENSHELICTHDLDGTILSVNRAATVLFGYEVDELVQHKNIRDLLAPEVRDYFDDYMTRICEEGATSGTMLIETRAGERKVLEYYNSLRTEGVDKPIVRGIARDTTEARRAQRRCVKAKNAIANCLRILKTPFTFTI